MSETILSTFSGGVLTVELNRPQVHNAFNARMVTELTQVFQEQARQDDVRIVTLRGRGPSFCAGADISSMRAAADADLEDNRSDALRIFDLMFAVNDCSKPVVACVQGAVFGGGVGLVSACDIVIAAENTTFAFSETRLGLIPAVISPFVVAKIGESQARELFLTGERFDATRAQRLGLVHHLAPVAALAAVLDERVETLLQAGPQAQAEAKALIRDVVSRPIRKVRELTAERIAERRASDEGREGLSAFLEKRPPKWRK
ncbi:MAG: enoyl-CoA hydratase/isomerase family protein [Candidatus Promineifilaceae bacterium]|nr:enoyl-CoA hydratase/isomerase family protein [Candidatus Promineifilaceae bacterium]